MLDSRVRMEKMKMITQIFGASVSLMKVTILCL